MFENHRWNPSPRAPEASAPAFDRLIRSFGICKSGLARGELHESGEVSGRPFDVWPLPRSVGRPMWCGRR